MKSVKILFPMIFMLISTSSQSASLCFCPEKPIGAECNNQCGGNPGGVVVILPNKPEQPPTNPFEKRNLWTKQSLEIFRKSNEKYRMLLETGRESAETKRIERGMYPPSIEYKDNMSEYFEGIDKYKSHMNQYRTLQRFAQ